MKYLIFYLLVFVSQNVLSQNNSGSIDSLKMYSYNFLGFKVFPPDKVKPAGGTGFFFRKDNRLFFVTAKHVLSGCLNDSTKDKDFPDTMNIVLHSQKKHIEGIFQISATEISNSIACNTIRNDPDIIVVELNSQRLKNVYSVESFVHPPFKKVSDFVVCGFPSKETVKPGLNLAQVSTIHFGIKDGQIVGGAILEYENNRIDSLDYYIKTDIFLDSLDGYSGSPVFIKDRHSSQWRIAGVLVGDIGRAQEKNQSLVVCKIDYLIKEIDTKLH
jgi:hypothetical protein